MSLLRPSAWVCLSYDRVPGCVSLTTQCLAVSLLRPSAWLRLSYDTVPGCVSLKTECLAASLLRPSAWLRLSYDRVPGCVSLTTECPAVSYDRVPGCVFLTTECLAVCLLRQSARLCLTTECQAVSFLGESAWLCLSYDRVPGGGEGPTYHTSVHGTGSLPFPVPPFTPAMVVTRSHVTHVHEQRSCPLAAAARTAKPPKPQPRLMAKDGQNRGGGRH